MADIAELGFSVDSGDVKRATGDLDKLKPSTERAERATDRLNGTFSKGAVANKVYAKSFDVLTSAAKGFFVAIASSLAFGQLITQSRAFSKSTAELSTLLSGGADELSRYEATARSLARTYGTAATEQIGAFYQAVSAGATSLSQATEILDAANKTAIGGVTDTTTAVDALTTAVNAYASIGLSAADASDTLFVGMKAGKTTIAELAGSLGNVIPIAASLGVGFDELVAGVAALTTQGQSTAQAVTGVRAILSQVAKPTSEAAKLAKELGLEFTSTALASQGLAKFLETVMDKTGGSVDKMALLFGSVEALNAVLSFAGGGGDAFTKILGDMEKRAGATQVAFEKVAQSLDQRLNVVFGKFGDYALTIGQVLLAILVPTLETLMFGFENIGDVLLITGPLMLAMFGPAVIAGVWAFTTAVAVGAVGAVQALTAAILANPLGALGVALATIIASVWVFRDAIKQAIGIDVQAIFEGVGNFIIQSFFVAFEQIKWIWGTLPNVMGSATIGAVNLVIDALNFMIGKSIEGINSLINLIRGIPGMDGMLSTLDPGSGQLGKMTDSFKQAADAGNAAYVAAVKTIGATNYVGQFAASFDKLNESASGTVKVLDELAGGSSNGSGGGGKGNSALDRTAGALQAAMDYADQTRAAFYELKETLAGMVTDALSGFFSDLRKGVNVVDALSDAVGRLADKLMDMVLNNAIQSIVGSMFGLGTIAGGAAIPSGGFIPGMTGPALFAKGGVFSGATAFDTGSGLGVAGEAGPEAILPLHRGSDGSLGVAMAANNNFGSASTQLNVAIYNNAANDVETTTSVGEDGSLIIMIDRLTAKNMADPASQTNRAVQRSFGVKNATKDR